MSTGELAAYAGGFLAKVVGGKVSLVTSLWAILIAMVVGLSYVVPAVRQDFKDLMSKVEQLADKFQAEVKEERAHCSVEREKDRIADKERQRELLEWLLPRVGLNLPEERN